MIAASLLGTIRSVILDPSSNPTVAFVLISLVGVSVLLALVLLLLAFIRPPSGSDEDFEDEDTQEEQAAGAEAAGPDDYEYPDLVPEEIARGGPATEQAEEPAIVVPRTGRRIGAGWIVLAAVAVVAAGSFGVTSTDRYCTGACHAHTAAVTAKRHDAHAAVACVSCHEDPSLAGALGAPFARIGHALRTVSPRLASPMSAVSGAACISCHGAIRGKTVTVTGLHLRMSHREPLAAGMSCGDCHSGTGHDSGSPVPPVMSICMPCHDGVRAPGSCTTCHTTDASRARRPSDAGRVYAPVRLAPMTDCGTCHDQTACDACHGLRMPHTSEFKAWSHARAASFDGRKTCLGCHVPSDCTTCHPGMKADAAPAHPADWKTSHQTQPSGSCACHTDRLPEAGLARGSYRMVCH